MLSDDPGRAVAVAREPYGTAVAVGHDMRAAACTSLTASQHSSTDRRVVVVLEDEGAQAVGEEVGGAGWGSKAELWGQQ